jgi:hypothetical protein
LDRRVLETGAVAEGISSALMMAFDVDPTNPWITSFLAFVPAGGAAAALWNAAVAEPARDALARVYPQLKAQHRLEELFRCGRGERD